jgi:integrase
VSCDGAVVGTMIHGLFENDSFRVALLRALRRTRSLDEPARSGAIPTREQEYDRLAHVVHERPSPPPSVGLRKPVRVHDLRATFVTVSLANGKTETWVQDRTGHKSTLMIARCQTGRITLASPLPS